MYARPHSRGMGAVPATFVAAQPGVTQAVSDQACTLAGGTPVAAVMEGSHGGGIEQPMGCDLPTLPELPSWCSFPGMVSLFDQCDINAVTQANSSAYTVYSVGQGTQGPASGIPAATAIADQAAVIDQSTIPDCTAWAAANQPLLSNFFGPDVVGSMLGSAAVCTPDASSTLPSWLLFAGIGLAALVVWEFSK